MNENVEKKEYELNRLWIEALEITRKWEDLVDYYVTSPVGLHPWNSDEKARDENGHLINIRTREGDDDFMGDYGEFERIYAGWSDRVEYWLPTVPPRFQHRFDEVVAQTERFSKQYDGQYTYVGEVPDMLDLYDDFCKKRAAIIDLSNKVSSREWSLQEDDDVAFKLWLNEMSSDLYINSYKVHHLRYDSDLEQALIKALDKNNQTHQVKMDASKLQTNVSKLKIPQGLRKLMIRTSKQTLAVNPEITYGDLKRAGLNDAEIFDELGHLS